MPGMNLRETMAFDPKKPHWQDTLNEEYELAVIRELS